MGCCCSSSNKKDSNAEVKAELQLNPIKNNEAVSCKNGLCGSYVKFAYNEEKKTYDVEGTGTALGSCALDCDVAYFEVRIGNLNPQGVKVGLKRISKKQTNLSGLLDDDSSNDGGSSQAWTFVPNNSYGPLKEGDDDKLVINSSLT